MTKSIVVLLGIVAVFAFAAPASAKPPARIFHTHLSGDAEVPAHDTDARGFALFIADRDEETIKYMVVVSNIDNVIMAHIHCGPVGVNGPIGVTLLMVQPPGGGPEHGVLTSGQITAPDPGNMCGWTSVEDVIEAMRTGNTYTNVHTNDGVDGVNTGPGDFPGGEIRGQNRALPPQF